jgi:hypothetical protein
MGSELETGAEPGAKGCVYPQSHATAGPIADELQALAANQGKCTSLYLDTVETMSHGTFEGADHHQGLARTHRLSDGSIYFFLTHSETDEGDQGIVAQFRYEGPTDGEHVLETSPPTVASMEELLRIDEQHPSDIEFLPDVNRADAGYLFITKEFVERRVVVYRWAPGEDLVLVDHIFQGFPAAIPDEFLLQPGGIPLSPTAGPNFLFLDRAGAYYYLGIASDHWGWGQLMRARDSELFPDCRPGAIDVSAFEPAGIFPYPVLHRTGASQVQLIRDGDGKWFLLAFHSDDPDNPHGADYVDLYGVRFEPFAISYLLDTVHVSFKPGDTGFASTGTHYVEESGRMLLLSSYRWAEEEGPGESSYVSRVDELPSS